MSKSNRGDRTQGKGRQGDRGKLPNSGRQRPKGYDHVLPGDNLLELARPRQQADRSPWFPKTDAQKRYKNAIEVYDLVFCKGPPGTGKTFVPAAMAADAFNAGEIDKIIITRPAVGAEEEYGFLKGDLDEKIAPWAKPVVDILIKRLGAGKVEYMLAAEQIEIAPLGMLRGSTFEDAFVIFDEAQNATVGQMKLFLTRIGENVKMIVDGDPFDQQDITGLSGFTDAWSRMDGHPQIGFCEFTEQDIVRSGLCRDILLRYREPKGASVGHAELGSILSHRIN